MRHADDGTLRRMLDEEWAVRAGVRRHVAECGHCLERLGLIRDAERDARRLMEAPDGHLDAGQALARQRLLQAETRGAAVALEQPPARGRLRWATGLAGFLTLLVLLAATPVGGYARNLLLIFEPRQFTAVPVAPGQVRSLIGLQNLGTMQDKGNSRLTAEADLAAAQAAVGFRIATPAALPHGLPAPSYAVLAQATQSLTLDQRKLASYAAKHHISLPPMPKNISGSILHVTTGPAVVISYGAAAAQLPRSQRMPPLVLAEAPVPKVFSTGAKVAEIEDYVLSLPGVSPELSAEIRDITDPTRTMPIPVPMAQVTSATVTLGAANGLWLQAKGQAAGGVVWTSGDRVYAVAGTLGKAEILSIASGLR